MSLSRSQMKKSEIVLQNSTGSSWAQKIGQLLEEQTSFNKFLDSLNGLFSFIVIFQYIYSTYDFEKWDTGVWPIFDFLFHTYFLIEWILRIVSSKDISKFLLSWESIADMVSILPFYAYKFTQSDFSNEDFTNNNQLLVNMLSLTRIMRLQRLLFYIENDILKQLLKIVLSALSMIILAAGILQFTTRFLNTHQTGVVSGQEIELIDLPFHYYIYFVMTTISTLGYDNPFNNSSIRIEIIILLVFSVIFVPQQSSNLISLLSKKSFYARRSYKIVESVQHILVTGVVSSTAAENFFTELFHQDHGTQAKHALLLLPNPPDNQLENLLSNPNLIYIEGQPQNEYDLKRCQLEKAKAVIILCNKQSSDPHWEDSQTILRAMVMKKYLKSNIRFCTQFLRQEGKTHYYLSLQETQTDQVDQVICIEELKMSLLAKSCLCPGLIALINNLITSSGNPTNTLEHKWLEDYWKGQGFEIYKTLLSKKYQGMTFSQAALSIYKNFRAILFGLEIISYEGNKIFLNPGSQQIPRNCEVIGYIIAEDKETADNISEYKSQGEDRNFDTHNSNQMHMNFSPQQFSHQQDKLQKDEYNFSQLRKDSNLPLNFQSNSSHNVFSQGLHGHNDEIEEGAEGNDSDVGGQDEQRQEHLKNAIIAGEWNKNTEKYYVAKEKIHLKDVTFFTLKNNILATNHIILCGAVDNFINFITPLRAKYLQKYPPIVLLNELEPTEKAWNLVSLFPDIYYIKGSSLNERDLIRANIEKALTIVILASELDSSSRDFKVDEDDRSRKSMELSKEQEDLLDAKTIFKYKAVQRLRPNIQIVTEFVNPQNIAFLKSDPADYALMKKFGYNHTPLFASGEIYISSIMDSLSCQAYYNPALIKVLNLLLLGDSSSQGHLTQQQQQQQAIQLQQSQFFRRKGMKSDFFSYTAKNSNLFHIQIPTAFLGKSFEQLFHFLANKQDIITLGLYRLAHCRDNKMPYVWTNPDPETILSERDLCFVLAQQTPSENYMEWGGPLEKRDHLKKRRRLKNYTSDSTQSEADEVPLNFEEMERTNINTRQYVKDSELVNMKINQIGEKIIQVKENTRNLEEMIKKRQQDVLENIKTVLQEELQMILKQRLSIQQQALHTILQQPLQQQGIDEQQQQLSDQSSLQPEDYEEPPDPKSRLIKNPY